MALFERFRMGRGQFKPELRAALESEGLVVLAEGLKGSIRYDNFKAPGKRFNGKVTASGWRSGSARNDSPCAAGRAAWR